MKKGTVLILVMGMMLAMAACGGKNAGAESSGAGQSSAAGSDAAGSGAAGSGEAGSDAAESSAAGSDASEGADANATGSAAEADQIEDARALLTAIWESHGEEEQFAAMGGDMSEQNLTNDAPGHYSLEDTAGLDNNLGLPESAVPMIDGAASLMHMMNANTFTCGAFHVSDAGNVTAVADALRENILQRQWMCGFPDKLIVISVEDYVISAFGNEELIDTFQKKATELYPAAQVIYEEPIV